MITMTTDKERYVCLNCYAVGPLSDSLRCSSCGSDVVVSAEQIQQVAPESRLSAPRHPVEHRGFETLQRSWYHIRCGFFETVVSYVKASSLDEALAYAKTSRCEWYFVDTPEREPFLVETALLSHSEFLEWCRGKWM